MLSEECGRRWKFLQFLTYGQYSLCKHPNQPQEQATKQDKLEMLFWAAKPSTKPYIIINVCKILFFTVQSFLLIRRFAQKFRNFRFRKWYSKFRNVQFEHFGGVTKTQTSGARFSKVPKLFERISGDIALSVSSKRRRLEARNFAVISTFTPFTTYKKISFTE